MLVTEVSLLDSTSRRFHMLFSNPLSQHVNSTWTCTWEPLDERVLSIGNRARHRAEFGDTIFHPSEQEKRREEERDQIKLGQEVGVGGVVHGEVSLAGLHLLEQTNSEPQGLPLKETQPRTNSDPMFL